MMKLSQISYGGWPNCLRLSDGKTELVVTTDVGPRIIRYGLQDGPNVLKEFPRQMGKTGGSKWRIFGGTRLWHAPEDRKRTYVPDNGPVAWSWKNSVLTLTQDVEQLTGIQKSIRISGDKGGAVRLDFRLANLGRKTQHLAPWTLSVMTTGGTAIFPQERYGSHTTHLLPARPLVLWPYTKMNDPRWTWGERFFLLKQDVKATCPQKVGFLSTQGWMAYALPGCTFIKKHPFSSKAVYPDFNCNAETFTNNEMLELETLGALGPILPGKSVEHAEVWNLSSTVIKDFSAPGLDRAMPKLLKSTPRA